MKKQKKKGNSKNKLIWIVGALVVALVLGSIIFQAIFNNYNKNYNTAGSNEDASDDWKAALASNDLDLIYLGRPTCSWCNKLRPHLNYMAEKYGVSFVYANMDEITSGDQTTLFGKLNIDASTFGTPYLAVIKDGKKVAEQVGFVPEDQLFKFLQTNELISKDAKYTASAIVDDNGEALVDEDNSAYKSIDFIDYSQYKTVYDKGDKSILVLGQTGCSYCNQYKPIINGIAKEKDITINYLDVRKITQDEWNTLISDLNDYFKDHQQWGTPLSLIIKDKKVVDALEGAMDEATTLKFYKDNGMIK